MMVLRDAVVVVSLVHPDRLVLEEQVVAFALSAHLAVSLQVLVLVSNAHQDRLLCEVNCSAAVVMASWFPIVFVPNACAADQERALLMATVGAALVVPDSSATRAADAAVVAAVPFPTRQDQSHATRVHPVRVPIAPRPAVFAPTRHQQPRRRRHRVQRPPRPRHVWTPVLPCLVAALVPGRRLRHLPKGRARLCPAVEAEVVAVAVVAAAPKTPTAPKVAAVAAVEVVAAARERP